MLTVTTNEGNSYILTGGFTHLPQELEVENKGWLLADLDEYVSGMKLLKLMLGRPRTNVVVATTQTCGANTPRPPSS
jgi:hypothetical protein